jgi:ubiquinone biosynthesis monooxygenase Coq6
MLAAVDKLNWIFGSRSPLINWARGTGLEVFNELGPIKDFFMANAGSGNSRARSEKDRVFGRSYASDRLTGGAGGLPGFLADAADALGMVRNIGRAAGDAVAEGVKVALRRGADALESRQTPPKP